MLHWQAFMENLSSSAVAFKWIVKSAWRKSLIGRITGRTLSRNTRWSRMKKIMLKCRRWIEWRRWCLKICINVLSRINKWNYLAWLYMWDCDCERESTHLDFLGGNLIFVIEARSVWIGFRLIIMVWMWIHSDQERKWLRLIVRNQDNRHQQIQCYASVTIVYNTPVISKYTCFIDKYSLLNETDEWWWTLNCD